MASEKNITMRQYNGVDYDTLYPKTKVEQVEGAYTQQQILSNSTKALYGLDVGAVPDDAFIKLNYAVSSKVIVTTYPNVSCAIISGAEKVATGVADGSGECVLYVKGLGDFTLVCTYAGASWSKDFNIQYIGIYDITSAPSLGEAPWEVISAFSENGLASNVFSIGDKKIVTIEETNYNVQIIGFNHDNKTAGGKAGITFQLVDCLNTTYQMSSSNTNVGGWKDSEMRTRMGTFLNQLPSDLQSVIKAVNKLTTAGDASSTIVTVSDKLFLLSEVEIFGSTTYSFDGEGSQYEWYKAGNTKVKKVNSSASGWWERSPYKTNNNSFCYVDGTEAAKGMYASSREGVSFAFCV